MEFSINLKNAASVISQMEAEKNKLNQYQTSVRASISKCPLSGSTRTAVCSSLKTVSEAISGERQSLQSMSKTLEQIIAAYRATETELAGVKASESSMPEVRTATLQTNGEDEGVKGIDVRTKESLFATEGSLLGGAVTGAAVTLIGINASGTAEGSLIGGSLNKKSSAKFDLEEGNVFAGTGLEANGYLTQGKLKGNIGLLGGTISGTIGAASATGSLGATLFKDGKFSPSLTAKAKAEAAAAKGEAEGKIGTESNNMHGKAEGTLFGAEAEASASAGKITYENSAGNTVTEYGVQGKVGAEAYVAEGKVSGGFTIFGIKVDAGISGKAGGAGVSASGQVTTGGASGSIGAGLGLGAGLEISIDWSNFSLW